MTEKDWETYLVRAKDQRKHLQNSSASRQHRPHRENTPLPQSRRPKGSGSLQPDLPHIEHLTQRQFLNSRNTPKIVLPASCPSELFKSAHIDFVASPSIRLASWIVLFR